MKPHRIPRHDELANCRRRCLVALREAMGERPTYSGLGWIEDERLAITNAANDWATAHGLPTVTVNDVERIEHMAMGHVDYATKLALYVAELVYGMKPRP